MSVKAKVVVRVDFKSKRRLAPMPATRGECERVVRPCPYVTCRYNMDGVKFSCALDAVEAFPDGMTLEEVGDEFGVTRERIRQIENKAAEKVKRRIELNLVSHKGYKELVG